MKKKNKRLAIAGLLLLFSLVVIALGLKYFPFAKLVRMPAGSEKVFVNPEKVRNFPPHTLYFDFEIPAGRELPGGFYKGLAHSGQYSVKAFGQNSFSTAVERTAKEIGIENLKSVAWSAWIYVFPTKNEVKGSFVFSVSNEAGVNVCWQGNGITGPDVPLGKWFKISKYFDLTAVQFKPDYKIQVYFWNNSKADILVDDYFISFGGAVDRRGDSARVDMTRTGEFTPEFNYPPFPVTFLNRVPVEKTIAPSEIGPDDLAIAGNFLGTGNDGLLDIKKNGKVAVFTFCREANGFRKIILDNSALLSAVAPFKKVVKGKFLSSQGDQFIMTGEKGWLLGALDPPENICGNSAEKHCNLKILWKSDEKAVTICAGEFNGDRRSEILVITETGDWKVMSFGTGGSAGGAWKEIATGNDNSPDEWVHGKNDFSVSAGRFITGIAEDVILTVARNKRDGKCTYSLRKLDLQGKQWKSLYSEKQHGEGRTIGLDTLKPGDAFFTVASDGNKLVVFRYNRDWRYDMKEIRFSDSTFSIISNVDFTGYAKDQNPKYYESLRLVPGSYLRPQDVSFMVIGHVAASRHYQAVLPDFTDLYSLPANK